jgi:murein DD-endopeptidase MepM/ murein hydrolase activator NlpD
LKKNIFVAVALLCMTCSHDISSISQVKSARSYPKLETKTVSCGGSGQRDEAKVVLNSSLKKLPQVEYVFPLPNIVITSTMECRGVFFHDGIDLAGITGTPIVSIADGLVTFAGRRRLTGNTVVVFHPESGLESTYGHASENLVRKGQSVLAGERIQLLGNTGQSTGAHLHLSISYQNAFVDPCALLFCR